ncbi:MAG: hypothetical protein ACQESF_00130 [Nanobdellota archaeon]
MEKKLFDFQALLDNFSVLDKKWDISLKSVDDLSKVKVTKRNDIHRFSINSCPEKPVYVMNTSGTLGTPTLFFISKGAYETHIKRVETMFKISGYNPHEVVVNMTEDPIANSAFVRGGHTFIHTGMLIEQNAEIIAQKILQTRPTYMYTYLSLAYDLFKMINKKGVVKNIVGVGSLVTKDFKNSIKELTGADFKMMYGTQEFGALGIQENEDDEYYSLIDDGLYTEVMNKSGEISENGSGALLITDYNNFSSPFIRYFVGDEVELMRKDGKTYLKVLGRCDNFIKLQGDVDSKEGIISIMQGILKHDNFLIEVTNDTGLNDYMTILVPSKDLEKRKLISEKMMEFYQVPCVVKALNSPVPKTQSGKRININDKRFS